MSETRYSYVNYTGDGSQTDFAVPFPYLNASDVHAYEDGVETSAWTWVNPALVRMDTAPASGVLLQVRRITPADARIVDFTSASIRDPEVFDEDSTQLFYIAQEALDWALDALRKGGDGEWDARGFRIENGGYAISLDDFVTVRYLQDFVSGGTSGVAGIYRITGTGDGVTDTFELIPAGEGSLTDKTQVAVSLEGDIVTPSEYELDSTKRKIVFNNPPGNGVTYDIWCVTSALTTFTDGGIPANKLAVPQDYIIVGDASGYGSAVNPSAVALSAFGVPTATIDMDGQTFTNLPTPAADSQPATKAYVDAGDAAAAPFGTITSGSAYTPGTIVPNADPTANLIVMCIQQSSGYTSGRTLVFQISANADMSAPVQVGRKQIQSSSTYNDDSLTCLVPAGYYWRVKEETGLSTEKLTLTFQNGVA